MNTDKDINSTFNSKGAPMFKKMLDDKKAIFDFLRKGSKISDLKDKYNFVNPLSTPQK